MNIYTNSPNTYVKLKFFNLFTQPHLISTSWNIEFTDFSLLSLYIYIANIHISYSRTSIHPTHIKPIHQFHLLHTTYKIFFNSETLVQTTALGNTVQKLYLHNSLKQKEIIMYFNRIFSIAVAQLNFK